MSRFRPSAVLSATRETDLTLTKPTIAFLNRCYWPDSEATGQLLTDLCTDLAKQFEVHVICGAPNSPTTDDYVRMGIENRDGVTIHRLSHTRFAKRIPAGRMLNIASFTFAAARYLRKWDQKVDVLVCETDPFLLPLVAADHRRRTGSKLICYLQDIYPDVAVEIDHVKPGWLTNQIRERLKTAYVSADHVVVLGWCMKQRLSAQPWSIDSGKIQILPNWADCQSIVPSDRNADFRERHDLVDKFVVMHSGNMGLTQQLDVLIDATNDSGWPTSAVLLLVGDGAAKGELLAKVRSTGSDRVRFLPYQPRAELGASLAAADLHVVSMHPRITGCLCPSKLYGILAAGRPVLAIADAQTDLCATVAEHRLGWTCPAPDAAAISSAVADAASDPTGLRESGERARQIALRCFDRPVVIDQFSSMLGEVFSR